MQRSISCQHPENSALARWGESRYPKWLVMISQTQALNAQQIYNFTSLGEQIELGKPILNVEPDNWRNLYRTHWRSIRNIVLPLGTSVFGRFPFDSRLDAARFAKEAAARAERSGSLNSATLLGFFNQVEDMFEPIYKKHLEILSTPMTEEASSIASLSEEERDLIIFLRKVAVPCWLLFGNLPLVIFRAARVGNFTALVRIIELDIRVLEDSTIRKRVYEIREGENESRKQLLETAILRGRSQIWTPSRVKTAIAARLSSISENFVNQAIGSCGEGLEEVKRYFRKSKLTAPDLSDLFDAATQDVLMTRYGESTSRGARDPHIPPVPSTFGQAIYRFKRDFPSIVAQPLPGHVF